jgi:hypothetical protein
MTYRPKISKEALQRILWYRQREEAKEKRKFDAIVRTSKVTSVILIIINFLLALDVYIMSHATEEDVITEAHMVYSRGRQTRGRITGFQIQTRKHPFGWEVRNTGYEIPGTPISYKITPLFKIVYQIRNLNGGYHLNRDFHLFGISKNMSIFLFLVGILGVVWKKFHELGYGLFAVFQIAATILEAIWLIF